MLIAIFIIGLITVLLSPSHNEPVVFHFARQRVTKTLYFSVGDAIQYKSS